MDKRDFRSSVASHATATYPTFGDVDRGQRRRLLAGVGALLLGTGWLWPRSAEASSSRRRPPPGEKPKGKRKGKRKRPHAGRRKKRPIRIRTLGLATMPDGPLD